MTIDLSAVAPSGDALLIVPPFAGMDRPSYGLHLLQALGARAGFRVEVLYANILFARAIGEERYSDICYGETGSLAGEKVFVPAAYGDAAPAGPPQGAPLWRPEAKAQTPAPAPDPDLQRRATAWTDELAHAIAALDYPIVGANLMFEQTTATVALFNRLRAIAPMRTLIVGGALCEGPMAEGVASLTPAIDVVFSGESEETFVDFLGRSREAGGTRVVRGKPCNNLDALPTADYDAYFRQIEAFYPDSEILRHKLFWLPYEGSRGCWWGQKHHCTFCGINGTGMDYRQRSAARVLEDLETFKARYPTPRVLMLDNIMPHRYFQDLLPALKERALGLQLFYEQKANLTLRRLAALADAGVTTIQPGIESLSDHMLTLMKKGVKTRQNIAALRFARATGVAVQWNLLYAFPGDLEDDYRRMRDLAPLLAHLEPPSGLGHLSIDRFSPYHETPERYGIRATSPMGAYADVFPQGSDRDSLAYHFEGDYDTASRRDHALVQALSDAVEAWREPWHDEGAAQPVLSMRRLGDDMYLIADTRPARVKAFHIVNRAKARAALMESTPGARHTRWALRNRLAVQIDDAIVPLAVADRPLFEEFFDAEAEERQAALAA
jgi:ribosomal peptide maturation radical SAM protein 1